jgi:hypothetical protein
MADPYYNARPESFDEFIPSHKADNAFLAHQCVDEQEQHHRIVRGSSSGQLSSLSDMDHKNRAPTRKRIQVAVREIWQSSPTSKLCPDESSVAGVVSVRSNAAVMTLAMVQGARVADLQELRRAIS